MRQKPNLAEQALIEAYDILWTLARTTHNDQWAISSVPRNNLDRLARKLGYKNVKHLDDTWYEPRVDDPCDGNGPFP